jgi:hypothetical protein
MKTSATTWAKAEINGGVKCEGGGVIVISRSSVLLIRSWQRRKRRGGK